MNTELTGFSLKWVHPRLPEGPTIRVNDQRVAEKFAEIFEGYNKPAEGVTWDCPMYDVIVTLHSSDGHSTEIKVYLPRVRAFPGMFKHPSGPLFTLDFNNYHSEIIGELLHKYMPESEIYPLVRTYSGSIEFRQGIPDFREINWPVIGEYPPGSFQFGGK